MSSVSLIDLVTEEYALELTRTMPQSLAIRRGVTQLREAATTPIEVPVRESRANGACERAVRTWECQFRTITHHVETALKFQLDASHPIWGWCGHWAANMLARVAVRDSGRATYELVIGHRMRTALACFGEKVWFRRRQVDAGQGKHEVEYTAGVYLGMAGFGLEHLIGTSPGVETTRDTRRLFEGDQWDATLAHSVTMSLEMYLWLDAEEAVVRPMGAPQACEGPYPPAVPVQNRRVRLLPRDFAADGFTPGCPGCTALRRKRSAQSHSEACRARIVEEFCKTIEGQQRLREAEARREKEFEAHFQAEDARQRQATIGEKVVGNEEKPPADAPSAEAVLTRTMWQTYSATWRKEERSAKRPRVATQLWGDLLSPEDQLLIARALQGVDLMEVHSPERINKVCRQIGLAPGAAFDLTSGWDLSTAEHRRKALELRRAQQPYVITCSPPCTIFSTLSHLNVAVHGPSWEAWHLEEKTEGCRTT